VARALVRAVFALLRTHVWVQSTGVHTSVNAARYERALLVQQRNVFRRGRDRRQERVDVRQLGVCY
jgi:hypothetical protein